MNKIKKSKELHSAAWAEQEKWETHLNKALHILKPLLKEKERPSYTITNYAAILLELNKNEEALLFLEQNEEEQNSEYFANYAIALAKNDPGRVQEIQKMNKKSVALTRSEYGIEAFIDWHGL